MSAQKAGDLYKNNTIETASRGKIVLMMYEHALKSVLAMKKALESNPMSMENIDLRHESSVKAEKIIQQLINTLDFSVDKKFCQTLMNIYNYILNQITRAHIKKDPKMLDKAIYYLEELCAGWKEMLKKESFDENNVKLSSLSFDA